MLPEHAISADDITAINCSPDETTPSERMSSLSSSGSSFKPLGLEDSTEEHFRSRDDEKRFYGAYGHIREKMDYSYHSHYQKQRQWLHDSIIDDILNSASQAELQCEPWAILVACAPGAEIMSSMEELFRKNHLPLPSMVTIDSGEIRQYLPEYAFFLRESPDLADSQTERECDYIAETLMLAALQSGRNVLFMTRCMSISSCRHNIHSLRTSSLSLNVGLIHVTPSLATVADGFSTDSQRTPDVGKGLTDFVEQLKSVVDYYCSITKDSDRLLLTEEIREQFTKVFGQQRSVEVPNVQRLASGDNTVCLKRHRLFSVLRSSEENHQSDDRLFYGRFAHIRATLDYSYHRNYTFERQMLQDAIISEFLDATYFTDKHGDKCTTPTEPWVVFTAGAMGSGKSYTMRHLVNRGLFPLLAFVRVDPDELRRYLPEFHLYIQQSPEDAGTLTR
ncbi:hypothetical protein FisN_1Lu324 [Fistulifera solaris]|uniref:Zeta toxin domain-containing protein n=1 Tax=Fistulifera solaris TaxID=1519565 RepID=A0A1Z5K4W4_FISSO|nr:hypothetical protein FisN_1Lu324 [Fistulifera solaris]|eukprot:GAX21008.1 hypothetical protein FisN_1Lu324 [Fistulifera solaris]